MDERDIQKARAEIGKFLRENGSANLLGRQVQVTAQIVITLFDSGEVNFQNPGLDEIMTRFLLSKGQSIYDAAMTEQSQQIMQTRKDVAEAKPSDAEEPNG